MSDRLVVFPVPLDGIEHREYAPSRPVTVLALAGPDDIGWADRRALVVDEHGNLDWIGTNGLGITDPLARPEGAKA